jgi:hypothetical protein
MGNNRLKLAGTDISQGPSRAQKQEPLTKVSWLRVSALSAFPSSRPFGTSIVAVLTRLPNHPVPGVNHPPDTKQSSPRLQLREQQGNSTRSPPGRHPISFEINTLTISSWNFFVNLPADYLESVHNVDPLWTDSHYPLTTAPWVCPLSAIAAWDTRTYPSSRRR